jgi:hypothetical protein
MKSIIFIIIILSMAFPVFADTHPPSLSVATDSVYLFQIRNGVRNLLGSSATANIWTDQIVDMEINASCRKFAMLQGIEVEDTVLTSQGLTDYALPNNVIDINSVFRLADGRKAGLRIRESKVSNPAEKKMGDDNATSTDHPKYYRFCHVGNSNLIRIDPPELNGITDTIIVDYAAYATNLTSDSTMTNIPYAGIELIIWDAYKRCLMMNRDPLLPVVIVEVKDLYQTYFVLEINKKSEPEYDPQWRNTGP